MNFQSDGDVKLGNAPVIGSWLMWRSKTMCDQKAAAIVEKWLHAGVFYQVENWMVLTVAHRHRGENAAGIAVVEAATVLTVSSKQQLATG